MNMPQANQDKRCVIVSIIEGVLFGCMTVFGRQLDKHGSLSLAPKQCLLLLLCCAVLIILCLVANRTLLRFRRGEQICKASKLLGTLRAHRQTVKACCIAFLAVSMLFWFLVLFPGIYWADAPVWFIEWDANPPTVTSKWSLLYTWLYHAIQKAGYVWTNTYEAGMALFVLFQGLLAFAAMCYIINCFANRYENPLPMMLVALFYGIHPLLEILYFSTAQDTPFMVLLGVVLTCTLQMIDDPDVFCSHKRGIVFYSVLLLLLCLVRNNGLYVAVTIAILTSIIQRKQIKRALPATIIPILLYLLYSGPILHLFAVDTSSTLQEMSSIPVQQIARVYSRDKESLDSAEVAQIESYISKDALETYETFPSISDVLKANLNTERILANPSKFLQLYISLGMSHPKLYVEGMLMNNLGQWYLGKSYPDKRMYHPWIESECATPSKYYDVYFDVQSQSFFPAIDRLVQRLFGVQQERFSRHVSLVLLCESAPYLWLLIFATGFALATRDHTSHLVLAPLMVLELTVFLAPVVIFRYVAPVVFCTPQIIATMLRRDSAKLSTSN